MGHKNLCLHVRGQSPLLSGDSIGEFMFKLKMERLYGRKFNSYDEAMKEWVKHREVEDE